MISKGPAVSPVVAAAVICLMVGGVAGYYTHYFRSHDASGPPASQSMMGRGARPSGGAPSGGGAPGGMPGGGMGAGGQQPSASATLTRLVRSLNTVEQVQNQGLSANQKQALLPVLTRMQGAAKLSDKECEEYAASINKVLSEPQKQALQSLQPSRGGTGGGGGMGGGMAGGYGRPAGGGMTAGGMGGRPAMAGGGAGRSPSDMGGMGGGGQADPERPFAGERASTALDGLMAHLKTPGAAR